MIGRGMGRLRLSAVGGRMFLRCRLGWTMMGEVEEAFAALAFLVRGVVMFHRW